MEFAEALKLHKPLHNHHSLCIGDFQKINPVFQIFDIYIIIIGLIAG